MKHFEHYPFLKGRMEKPVFFMDLLNRYFFLSAFTCSRYHQSLAQVLDKLFEFALTKRIIVLGKYDAKKVAGEFQELTACAPELPKKIAGLSPEGRFLLVNFMLYFQQAFDNGYRKDALVHLLQLLVHLEKRYGDLDSSASLFRKRQQEVVFPTGAELNKAARSLRERLNSGYYTRKKITWSDPGFDAILQQFCNFLRETKNLDFLFLQPDVTDMIERHFQVYYDRWVLVSEIKSAVLKGEPI